MLTAWDMPRNPLSDALDDSPLFRQVQWGFRIFMNTPGEAGRFTPGKMSCANCHLNAGQRERSLPLVNVAGMFPEYNRRAGRIFSLNDRIVGCFYRSQNATGRSTSPEGLPSPTSPEVQALAAYLVWLSRGAEMGKTPEWRGQNRIPVASRIPIDESDPQRGEELFLERCMNCHGTDGQGVEVGDKKPKGTGLMERRGGCGSGSTRWPASSASPCPISTRAASATPKPSSWRHSSAPSRVRRTRSRTRTTWSRRYRPTACTMPGVDITTPPDDGAGKVELNHTGVHVVDADKSARI